MSASSILSRLKHNGSITKEEYDKLMRLKAQAKAIPRIKAEIENQLFIGRIINSKDFDDGLNWCLGVTNRTVELVNDKHSGGQDEK